METARPGTYFAFELSNRDRELRAVFKAAYESGEYDHDTGRWLVDPWTPEEFRDRIKATGWWKRTQDLYNQGVHPGEAAIQACRP
jgi:hypothetical protein